MKNLIESAVQRLLRNKTVASLEETKKQVAAEFFEAVQLGEERSLSRDPFARHNVIKQTVEGKECDNCGQPGKNGKLFQYGIDPDAGKKSFSKGKFCSKGCHNSYHG